MSEQSKTVELKDEDLAKVSGGAQIEGGAKTFEAGDWYICKTDGHYHAFNVKTTTTCNSTEDTVPCVEWATAGYGLLASIPYNQDATPTAGLLLSGNKQPNANDFANKNCVQ